MKEQYYTAATIQTVAQQFCKTLSVFRDKHPLRLIPAQTALLVIDMQNFFLEENSHAFVPSAPAIVPNIQALQNCFIERNLVVLQTQHGNTIEDAQQMANWWGSHILNINDPRAQIFPAVINPNVSVLKKSQYDAFYQTNLENILKNAGIKQVIITGVMAHLCCESTARSAFTRGFEVFFAIDATATYNREFHFGTLKNLAHGCAIPVLTDEILCQIKALSR